MKKVNSFELKIVNGGNGIMRVFFEDGSDEFFTVAAPTLASYQAVLSQPRVFYDPNNHFFTTERMEGAAFHAA